ncbi:MAG: hypothetical protein V1659_03675 [Candidatus Woesearchaeota archaeon]
MKDLKNLIRRLKKSPEEYFLIVYFTVTMTVFPYILGRMIYDGITADKRITIEDSFTGGKTYYGYDEDKNGTIDRIIEHSGITGGPRMPTAPIRLVYTKKDKEFYRLVKLFD